MFLGVTELNPPPEEADEEVELAAVVSMDCRFRGVFLNTALSSGGTEGIADAISSGVESA
jgi:hypothetical protein